MVKQKSIGLNSRDEANPYDNNGFLPLITAPMYSVVNEDNFQFFLDNKIQVCLPRNNNYDIVKGIFNAMSLEKFITIYVSDDEPPKHISYTNYVCIDTANGNMPALHEAIRKAKEIHGDNLIIMAGNVASVEAFVELAKTGVDYIRVGIGGGGGCNTTSNTGIGQINLEKLIKECYRAREVEKTYIEYLKEKKLIDEIDQISSINLSKVKIVADGISSYIKQCQDKYGFNDNGYAAINKLLFAGADLVMVGKLFAQCLESAGEKSCFSNDNEILIQEDKDQQEILFKDKDCLFVKYSGMSTHQEQKKYKSDLTNYVVENCNGDNIIIDRGIFKKGDKLSYGSVTITLESDAQKLREGVYQYKVSNFPLTLSPGDTLTTYKRPSEGSVNWINVRWTLLEWLHGAENQDNSPYLMGWINSIKSAMSYAGKKNL